MTKRRAKNTALLNRRQQIAFQLDQIRRALARGDYPEQVRRDVGLTVEAFRHRVSILSANSEDVQAIWGAFVVRTEEGMKSLSELADKALTHADQEGREGERLMAYEMARRCFTDRTKMGATIIQEAIKIGLLQTLRESMDNEQRALLLSEPTLTKLPTHTLDVDIEPYRPRIVGHGNGQAADSDTE